jgi:hypothetical protein
MVNKNIVFVCMLIAMASLVLAGCSKSPDVVPTDTVVEKPVVTPPVVTPPVVNDTIINESLEVPGTNLTCNNSKLINGTYYCDIEDILNATINGTVVTLNITLNATINNTEIELNETLINDTLANNTLNKTLNDTENITS